MATDMTLDEIIMHEKELSARAKRAGDKRGAFYTAKEHADIAKCLEDYLHVRKWKDEVIEAFCRYDASNLDELIQKVKIQTANKIFDALTENYENHKHAPITEREITDIITSQMTVQNIARPYFFCNRKVE